MAELEYCSPDLYIFFLVNIHKLAGLDSPAFIRSLVSIPMHLKQALWWGSGKEKGGEERGRMEYMGRGEGKGSEKLRRGK